MKIPKLVTVLVDSREKRPLIFPDLFTYCPDRTIKGQQVVRIKSKSSTMPFGDYALKGFEGRCCIERKGSVTELWANLFTKDRRRFEAATERLVENCETPVLLLDFSLQEFYRPTREVEAPHRVLDELLRISRKYRLLTIFAGNSPFTKARRNLGELIVRILLPYALERKSPNG